MSFFALLLARHAIRPAAAKTGHDHPVSFLLQALGSGWGKEF